MQRTHLKNRSNKRNSVHDYGVLEKRQVLTSVNFANFNLAPNGDFESGIAQETRSELYSDAEIVGIDLLNSSSQFNLIQSNISGAVALQLDSSPDTLESTIQQVETQAGSQYLVSFLLRGQGENIDRTNDVRVIWNNQSVGTFSGADRWQRVSVVVDNAIEGLSELQFREIRLDSDPGGDGRGPLIDDIRVFEVNERQHSNGGFELDLNEDQVFYRSEEIPSWNSIRRGDGVDLLAIREQVNVPGNHYLYLDASPVQQDGVVSNIRTTPGQDYVVTLDLRANADAPSELNQLRVRWNNEHVGSVHASNDWKTVTFFLPAGSSDQGQLVLRQIVEDTAGDGVWIDNVRINEVMPVDATAIEQLTPSGGDTEVNVNREARIQFSRPIDPNTINSDTINVFSRGEAVSGRLEINSTGEIVTFFPDSPWPDSSVVRVTVDGEAIRDLQGRGIDTNRDGSFGSVNVNDFETLSLTLIPDTALSGRILQSNAVDGEGDFIEQPIEGVTLSLQSRPDISVVTDANGEFVLTSPEGLPAGDIFVLVDGSTAVNVDEGFEFPTLVELFTSVAGQTTNLQQDGEPFDVFLPLIDESDIVDLDPDSTTAVGFGEGGLSTLQQLFPDVDATVFERTQVSFAPGSAQDDQGNAATRAAIIPVAPDRIPAPLPDFLNPQLVISIQAGDENGMNAAGGATRFDTPAEISFPNLEGLAPGEQALIFSFDEAAGEFVVVGTGTVSDDGLMIESDGGVIQAPGWHFTNTGTEGDGDGDNEPEDGFNPCLAEAHNRALDPNVPQEVLDALQEAGVELQEIDDGYGKYQYDEYSFDVDRLPPGLTPQALLNELLTDFNGTVNNPLFDAINEFDRRETGIPQVGDIYDIDILGPDDGDVILTSIADDHFIFSTITDPGDFLDTHPEFGSREFGFETNPDGSIKFYTRASSRPRDLAALALDNLRTAGWSSFIAGLSNEINSRGGQSRPNSFVREFHEIEGPSPCVFNGNSEPLSLATVVRNAEELSARQSEQLFYRIEYSDPNNLSSSPITVSGLSDESGLFSAVIPNGVFYTIYSYNPATTFTAISSGQASEGPITEFGSFALTSSFSFDEDRDGLDDLAEFVIGTAVEIADTDGDGISDSVELEQGTNPLDGTISSTGLVAAIEFDEPTTAIDVAGDNVFVTSGNQLSIVDNTQFDQPVVLGEVQLSGNATDVVVDDLRDIAVVATGLGIDFIDISDPLAPTMLTTVSSFAQSLEIFNGFVYAGSGSRITTIDIASQTITNTLDLGVAGSLNELTRVRDELYTFVDGSDNVVSIDLSQADTPTVLDTLPVSIASSEVGLFAGNGVLWLAGSGLRTIDINDPANLQVIQTPVGNEFFTARRVALNGSGLAAVLPDGGNFVQIYDTSDPNNVSSLVTQFNLGGDARELKLSRGIGFVAAGNRLEIFNPQPFDANGIAPSVSILTDTPDVDLSTGGIQVFEGTNVSIIANTMDDVQVRDVELIVNGDSITQDVSFPFDLSLVAPLLSSGVTQLDIQVQATDTGGNATLSEVLTIDVVPDTIAPNLVSTSPIAGEEVLEGGRILRFRFDEPLSEQSIDTNVFRVVSAGLDGVFASGDEVVLPISVDLRDNDQLIQIEVEDLEVGPHRIAIQQQRISDRAGNILADDPLSIPFDVVEATPIFQGNNPDIVFVFDVSGSTGDPFQGTPVGDINGDGTANDILDAELAWLTVLNQEIINLGLAANIGLVPFGENGIPLDLDPLTDGDQFLLPPGVDLDGSGQRDIVEFLASIDQGSFGAGFGTNFEGALQAAINIFESSGTPAGQGNIVFLSDGSGSGFFEDEVEQLAVDLGVNIRAFGVGNGANLDQLMELDSMATLLESTDDFIEFILTGGIPN